MQYTIQIHDTSDELTEEQIHQILEFISSTTGATRCSMQNYIVEDTTIAPDCALASDELPEDTDHLPNEEEKYVDHE